MCFALIHLSKIDIFICHNVKIYKYADRLQQILRNPIETPGIYGMHLA